MKNKSFLSLIIAILFFSCERDDICAEGTPTTPRLLIEFFDAINTDELKTVPRLSVYAEEVITDENGVTTFPEVASNATLIFNENSNTIELPLKVTAEDIVTTTRYFFETNTNLRLDDNVATNSNIDILDVTYTPEFIYVSRACGFKSVFSNVALDALAGDDGIIWLQNNLLTEEVTENENSIENEDNTHVQIFH